jgi:hypothetical protein
MRHIKHMDCSHALEEDAPKVWGHGTNSKWVKRATERRTPWSGGVHKNAGRKHYVGIQYIIQRNSNGGSKNQLNHLLLTATLPPPFLPLILSTLPLLLSLALSSSSFIVVVFVFVVFVFIVFVYVFVVFGPPIIV